MEATTNAKLSRIIGEIYDCSLDAGLWPSTLESLTDLFGARDTVILAHDPVGGGAAFLFEARSGADVRAAYLGKFAAINPLMTAGWHTEIDKPANVQTFMTVEEFQRTRFYKEFAAPVGFCDLIGVPLQKSARRYTVFSAARGPEAGMTGARELQLMALLAPHVRRAISIHDALDAKGKRVSNLSAAVDLAPAAIFLLDHAGRCLEANRAAERFLAEYGGASLESGRLLFANAEIRARLVAALAARSPGEGGGATRAGLTIKGRSFALEMLPLSGSGVRSHTSAALAVFLHEIGDVQPLPGEVLVKLYGLTPAETRLLVLLAQAMSLGDAAETLGISELTARTHLKRVFEKTGTHRQAEVVKLVMSALPHSPDGR